MSISACLSRLQLAPTDDCRRMSLCERSGERYATKCKNTAHRRRWDHSFARPVKVRGGSDPVLAVLRGVGKSKTAMKAEKGTAKRKCGRRVMCSYVKITTAHNQRPRSSLHQVSGGTAALLG